MLHSMYNGPKHRDHNEQMLHSSLTSSFLRDHLSPPSRMSLGCRINHTKPTKDKRKYEASLPDIRPTNSTSSVPLASTPCKYHTPPREAHLKDSRRLASVRDTNSNFLYIAPAIALGSTTTDTEPKTQRAVQACDNCRQLKVKCDEQKPCKSCRDKSLSCIYRDLKTKQLDKISTDIFQSMSSLKDLIVDLSQRMTSLEQSISKTLMPSSNINIASIGQIQVPESEISPVVGFKDPIISEHQPSLKNSDVDRKRIIGSSADVVGRMALNEFEQNPGQPLMPGRPSLPICHTARAALLLEWPSINRLVKRIMTKENIYHIDEFSFSQEQERRPIWGGRESHSSSTKVNSDDRIITDITVYQSHDESRRGKWTTRESLATRTADLQSTRCAHNDSDFDHFTVKQYVQSFKDNVLNVYPILISIQLDALVTVFLDSLHESGGFMHGFGTNLVHNGRSNATRSGPQTGYKRKRSLAAGEHSSQYRGAEPHLSRNITNALMLCILALGKFCLHNKRIVVVAPNPDIQYQQDAPLARGGKTSSVFGRSSPGSPSIQALGFPTLRDTNKSFDEHKISPLGFDRTSRVHGAKHAIERIPGLEYFTLADEIFRLHITGYTLQHVHVALFLGLYHGQLGRISDSWWYISHAGTILQVILRPSLSRFKELKENNRTPESDRDNQLAFAFWTCFQLESDILAELPMPPSGILTYEEGMPFPNISQQANDGNYSSAILASYQAQIWARRQLNKAIHQLYTLGMPGSGPTMQERTELLKKMDKSQWIPPEFQFQDSDEPAQDFLAARLRAKYWEFHAIVYRQYIDAILHDHPLKRDLYVLDYARLGIFALVQSTKAFHALKESQSIAVYDVFTTAHVQWGNLLVLSACYKHDVLQKYVEESMLQKLFTQTMEFFESIAHSGGALKKDLCILHELYKELGFSRTNEK